MLRAAMEFYQAKKTLRRRLRALARNGWRRV